jgi:hypothetical protein
LPGCELSHVLLGPDEHPRAPPVDERRREAPERLVTRVRPSENDHAQRHAGILKVEEIALHMLPGAPARLDLEPDHW